MRLSLFWKILIGFWIAFIVAVQLLWVVVAVYHDDREVIEETIRQRVSSAIDALRHGGQRELELIIRTWPPKEREYLTVEKIPELSSQLIIGKYYPEVDLKKPYNTHKEMTPQVNQYVLAQDNSLYHVQYDADKLRTSYLSLTDRYLFNIHEPLMFLGLFGGFIFSSFMAWNLARPLRFIRQGFSRVAQGDLSVRLYPKLKRRKDEITDVAKDFDHMVGRIDQLSSAREQLLHDISHELRTPLARIHIALGLAQQSEANIPTTFERIERETQRLDSLIGEVLTLARIDNNAFDNDEYFDFSLLIEGIIDDVRFEATQRSIFIVYNLREHSDWLVKGSAELLHRAIENVLRNALRFSSEGHTIFVDLQVIETNFEVTIRDQGPGVDNDKLDFIFEAFGRLQNSGIKDGYGLGLSITKKAIMAHGGRIKAFNHSEGGLVVKLSIPNWQSQTS